MDSARMLDKRMREVRQNGRVIGADRIAVMAALNLVYDLMQERDEARATTRRLEVLQERLAAAVGDPAEESSARGVDGASEKG